MSMVLAVPPNPMRLRTYLGAVGTGVAAMLLAATTPAKAQDDYALFTDEETLEALNADPVLKNLQGQRPVQLISALMPGLYDEDRLLEASQRAALDGIQRRLRDDADILTFIWIGPPARLPYATADNVRLVRDRTDGQAAAVLLFTPDPARYAILCSQPLLSQFDTRESTADTLAKAPEAGAFRNAPGETLVQHIAGLAERLMARSAAKVDRSAPPVPAIARSLPPAALPAQPPPQEGIEPREILIVALAASVGGLFVGLLLFVIQARRHKARARDMSSHFVVAAQSPSPVPETSMEAPAPDYSALAASMPAADSSIEERLQLAQVRLLSLRQSAEQLQQTMNVTTADLLSHIEREVHELELLRQILQRRS